MGSETLLFVIASMATIVAFGEGQNTNCLRNKTLEPIELNFDSFKESADYPAHPCLRECTNAPMQCEYTFVVEWYYTMAKACYDCPCNLDDCQREQCVAADGVPRPIIVANRTLPGPAIEVCEGDEVIVNVINHMDNGEAITLHWHGLYQKSNQYMDGVFMLTQCPITSHNAFRYNYTADHPGTHWWHAHTGMHRADGLFGPLIIRQSSQENPHSNLYDFDLPEHKVVINDWLHKGTVDVYLDHHFRGADDEPVSILVNGKGAFASYSGGGPMPSVTPRELYKVQQGKRYRFRVISSGITNIPLKISVDDHNITLISSDGDDFEPLEVDAFFLFGGERYDFILNASQDIGNYWLKIRGYNQGTGLHGLAIIRYEGAPDEIPQADPSEDRQGKVYQDFERSHRVPDTITTVNELRSMSHKTVSNGTYRRIYLPLDLQAINNPMFNDPDLYPLGQTGPGWAEFMMPQMNRRTLEFGEFPLLSQFDDELAADGAYDLNLCEVEEDGYDDCDTRFCACTQYIKADIGQTVEIVLIDESNDAPYDIEHPFHLHGHPFRILAQGRLGNHTSKEEVIELDQNGGIVRNYDHPPEKDTVNVPSGGYTVIEFVADNPGWWILHCHMEYHLEDGMGILIRVGDQSDLPPVPEGFPRCGDYPPTSSESSLPPSESTSNINVTVIILIVIIVLLAIVIIILFAVILCRCRSADDGKGHPQPIAMHER